MFFAPLQRLTTFLFAMATTFLIEKTNALPPWMIMLLSLLTGQPFIAGLLNEQPSSTLN